MSKVTVVDYGASNLLNVVRALEHCNADVEVTNHAPTIAQAGKLILPGVGAFSDCSKALADQGLDAAISDYIRSGKLFLGICVGMQILFDSGEEFGTHKGLGIIPGTVVRIPDHGPDGSGHKIPHMGWSDLRKAHGPWQGTLLAPVEKTDRTVSAYFVHSFMGKPVHAEHILADVDYNGISICAAVHKDNVYGLQFHPEKSGEDGLAILGAFVAQS
ncbi:MAG: imidazole glycerol phosphate synthase subunit HisH [Alphaproteobacteria bacterium]